MAITDLTNTTWTFDWVSRDYIQDHTVHLNFSCNGVEYTNINLYIDSTKVYIRYNDVIVSNNYYYYGEYTHILKEYETITITGGTDVTNPDVIAWIVANTVRPWIPEKSTILYDNVEIAGLEVEQLATLSCKGKKAKTDITINFVDNGTITYNGITTEVERDKIASLDCNGKIMKSDVLVSIKPYQGLATVKITNISTQYWGRVYIADIYFDGYGINHNVGIISKTFLVDLGASQSVSFTVPVGKFIMIDYYDSTHETMPSWMPHWKSTRIYGDAYYEYTFGYAWTSFLIKGDAEIVGYIYDAD